MPNPIAGLHHVTAITTDPQRNLDFYTEVLGLRFVKRTVNFDDPGTYHLYFGDDAGSPGTILTFFAWPNATHGSVGIGETSAVAFGISLNSLGFWENRLLAAGIPAEHAPERFGDRVLSFADPDGMRLELVAHASGIAPHPPRYSNVPADHAIHGFFGVTLCEGGFEMTAALLEKMGFGRSGEEGSRYRFSSPGEGYGRHIDVVVQTQLMYGRMGAGSVHHIAFRTPTDETQKGWRQEIKAMPLDVTPVLDRTYFHSIYFREPGGVLFEIATEQPGFGFDEDSETLGEALKLPPWLEAKRSVIERVLPPITLHQRKL